MPPNTPRPVTRIDVKKKAWEQEPILHNRWHPDIPAVGVIWLWHAADSNLYECFLTVPVHAAATACFAFKPLVTSLVCTEYQLLPVFKGGRNGAQLSRLALAAQVGTVQEGELFRIETLDWTGGQIGDNDSADDVKTVDLTQARCVCFPTKTV